MKLEEQKEIWRKEQMEIASQVEILPDDADPQSSQSRFRSIPLEHADNSSKPCCYYGGVDVSFPTNETDQSVAVYVVLEYPSNKIVYQDYLYFSLEVPYIPSYLAFREIEPLRFLIQKQKEERPDLTPTAILVDGNGILHPRKAGIACFVGVKTDIPTIGIGKTLFYEGQLNKELVLEQLQNALVDAKNEFVGVDDDDAGGSNSSSSGASEKENFMIIDSRTIPKEEEEEQSNNTKPSTDRGELVQELSKIGCRGIAVPLVNEGNEILACALVGHGGRTRGNKKPSAAGTKNPIYVSIGHKISLQEAVRITAMLSLAKIPEPVRQADLIGRELLRQKESKQQQQ